MRLTALTLFLFVCSGIFAQKIDDKLSAAIKGLETDPQFKHAILSMYVVDSKTGNVVYEKNAQLGLAPASCQKVVTSVSAFEMLGNDYRYKTRLYTYGEIKDSTLSGGLYVEGSGDPTLGSWRYGSTKDEMLFRNAMEALATKGIKKIKDGVSASRKNYDANFIPGGWPWEDLGNYYGAAPAAINWHENQYDLVLSSGNKIGDRVLAVKFIPNSATRQFHNNLRSAAKGTGDNANIYLGIGGDDGSLSGTIPIGENAFVISGAVDNPYVFFENTFDAFLKESGMMNTVPLKPPLSWVFDSTMSSTLGIRVQFLLENLSPSLDSINYFFLKRSVNLYGEALVKTIAYEKTNFGSTDTGLNIIKDFWNSKGIERSALHIIDGSGLSPANRVTTNALVTVMQYAKQQSWFPSFYNALPELNGIKMKDGFIGGVRAFTGYVKSKDGNEYTFSFIVNNFDGSAGTVREKMWKVLDILK